MNVIVKAIPWGDTLEDEIDRLLMELLMKIAVKKYIEEVEYARCNN